MAMDKILASEITPEHLFRSRRQFIRSAAALAAGSLALAACGQEALPAASSGAPAATAAGPVKGATDELGDVLTAYDAVTGYNNYYEFTTDKESVAGLAKDFKTTPWTVEIGGL